MESTQTLIENARAGDGRAIEKLYERYLAPLQRWARGRLPAYARDLAETSDIVQDSVLASLRNLHRFDVRHEGAFLGYLKTAVLHRLRDEIRRAGRMRWRVEPAGMEAGTADAAEASPVEQAIGRETLAAYERALERLEPGERELIVARVELGLSFSEVAAATERPSADAARMAVRRALLRLAGEMARDAS